MIREHLSRVLDGQRLSRDEMAHCMGEVLRGEAAAAQVAALLGALRVRGESVEELVGAALAVREVAVRVPSRGVVVDTCGTGGDAQGTFNVSTAAALVASACGIMVAKHGNRSVSSRCGSADVLEAMGARLDLDVPALSALLEQTRLAFLFAPAHHPAFKRVANLRRELGVRTVFNLIGPLANPAGAQRQVLGVFDPKLAPLMADVLLELGAEHALVVHGEGLDEISVSGPTVIEEVRDGLRRRLIITPEALGLERHPMDSLRGGDAAVNAALILSVLDGAKGGPRDAVLANGAAALLVGGHVSELREGVVRAAEVIDSGAARAHLERFLRVQRGDGTMLDAIVSRLPTTDRAGGDHAAQRPALHIEKAREAEINRSGGAHAGQSRTRNNEIKSATGAREVQHRAPHSQAGEEARHAETKHPAGEDSGAPHLQAGARASDTEHNHAAADNHTMHAAGEDSGVPHLQAGAKASDADHNHAGAALQRHTRDHDIMHAGSEAPAAPHLQAGAKASDAEHNHAEAAEQRRTREHETRHAGSEAPGAPHLRGNELEQRAGLRHVAHHQDGPGRFFSMLSSVGGPARLIAEVKRRSPSAGPIAEIPDAAAYARDCVAKGAAAISVLTNEADFGGSLNDLHAVCAALEVPVLRKEFIVDPRQLDEAEAAGADAVLLIVAVLGSGLRAMLEATRRRGLDALVEVHDETELARALDAGATVIGINNRDLRTFQVDLSVSERLVTRVPAGVKVIAESGVRSQADLERLRRAGLSNFLVGELFARGGALSCA
jgi:anthranilate phosphoribosyltransferase